MQENRWIPFNLPSQTHKRLLEEPFYAVVLGARPRTRALDYHPKVRGAPRDDPPLVSSNKGPVRARPGFYPFFSFYMQYEMGTSEKVKVKLF